MKPYYQDSAVTIYHGDCREVMPGLKADALITDPPFGINWPRATWGDDSEAYPALIGWLVSEVSRAVSGWCFVFQAMLNVGRFHEWFPDGWRLFAACKNFAQIRPTGIWHSWDPVVFWSNADKPFRSKKTNRDYHVGNVAGMLQYKNGHPCPRPEDTMRHLASIACPPSGLILDPFMGSGTTLRAAKDLGRKAIGIEISEAYCEIAAKRMSQEVLPLEATA